MSGLGGPLAADLLRQVRDKGAGFAAPFKHDAHVGADRARTQYDRSTSTPGTTSSATA